MGMLDRVHETAVLLAAVVEPDPVTVTPGPVGFLAILLIAVAALLLGLDLVRRVRRVRYREAAAERVRDERGDRDGTPD